MEDSVKLAISKIKSDDIRDKVAPGTYNIDATIRVVGELKVNEDYERSHISVLPHTEVLALALHLCGVQQDRAIKSIREAVMLCLSQGESAVGCIKDQLPTIEAEIKRIKDEIVSRLPKQQCKGNVKFTPTLVTSVNFTGDSVADEANSILKELNHG